MKKTLAVVGTVLTLSAGASGNLCSNGDFSKGMEGWRSFNRNYKEFYKSENGALVISGKDGMDNLIGTYSRMNACPEVGKKYYISARVKADVASSEGKVADIVIRYINAKGSSITYRGITIDLGRKGVCEYGADCKDTPAGTVSAQVFVRAKGLTAGDTVVVDDVNIAPLPELQASAGNLITNGDFEFPVLMPWYTSRGRLKNQYFFIVKDGENRVLAVTGDTAKYAAVSLLQRIAPLDVNKKYKLTAKVKAANIKNTGSKKTFSIRVRSAGAKNKSLTYAERYVKLDNNEWQTCEFTFKPHKLSIANQVYICSVGFEPGDMVLVDDVVLTQVD